MTKPLSKLLIANRGEVAIRIARAAEELGIATLAVYAEDDASALHTQKCDARQALRGRGARAYLDAEQLVRVAQETGCDAVHPGYGFLSESAPFAERCAAANLSFVGPRSRQLAQLGDKLQARVLAEGLGVPVARGSAVLGSVADAQRFYASLGAGPRCSRPHSAAAGAACAWWSAPPISRAPSRAATRKQRRRSATARSTWRSCSCVRATSRCRSSAMAAAPWCTWASASARCSAATRS